jgi:hypothetical protein
LVLVFLPLKSCIEWFSSPIHFHRREKKVNSTVK